MAKKDDSIKIKLKSYDHALLDKAVEKIISNVKRTGAKIIGPVPLPTKKEIFTVLESPHVNKTAREQFERRTHKRWIEIKGHNAQTIEVLTNLNLPSGIDILVKR